jgi:hypothetical protein
MNATGPFARVRAPLSLSLLILALTPGDAAAYLDPGSGSFVFQILISALLGAAVVLKTSWRRLRDFFLSSRRHEDHEDDVA